MLFSFVESKDSRSAREFSGENQMTAQSAWLTLMKVREALAITLDADGPLSGRIEAVLHEVCTPAQQRDRSLGESEEGAEERRAR